MLLRCTYLVLGVLWGICTFSQNGNLDKDSLQNVIESSDELDPNGIDALIHLGYQFDDQIDEQKAFFEEAYRRAGIGKHYELYVTAADELGVWHYYYGDYVEAEKYLLEAEEVARNKDFKDKYAEVLLDLGQVEDALGKDEQSVRHTMDAIDIVEESKNYRYMVQAYINLGAFYYYRDYIDDALKYYEMAKAIILEYEDISEAYLDWAIVESSIGWCYYYKDDLVSAIDQMKRAVEIHNKYDYYSTTSGESRAYLASLYVESKQFDMAEVHAQDALDICNELQYTGGLGLVYDVIGEINFKLRRYSDAAQAYTSALMYADTLGDLHEQSRRAELLAQSYKKMNRYELAFTYLHMAKIYEDSLAAIETEAAFEDAVTKYETEKAEAENELLTQQGKLKDLQLEKERQEAQAEKEQQWIIGGAIGLVLLTGLFFLINRNRLKTKTNKQLEQQRDEITEQKKEITDSITYAKNIQTSFLPKDEDFLPHFEESFLMYEPKDIVAGDFYILEETKEYVFFSVADCTGHGVPGAMVSIVCSNAIRKVIHEMHIYDPGKVLDKTREIVISQFERKGATVKDGMDISFCRLDKKNMKLAWAGANNSLLMIRNGNGVLHEIKPNKQPIGGYITYDPFTTHEVDVQKGDLIYMSSDGYPDQFGGEKGKKYKYKRFKELLVRVSQEKMRKQKEMISSEFWEWKQGFEQIDDVCVMGVKI